MASRSTNNDNQEFEVPCGDQTLDCLYYWAANGSVFTLVIAGKSPFIASYFEASQAGCLKLACWPHRRCETFL